MYELTFLVNPSLSSDELASLLDRIKGYINLGEGQMKNDFSGKRINLAYPIKKIKQAYLYSFDFDLSKEKIERFKDSIKNEKDIIRNLLITKHLPKYKPAKIKKIKPQTLKTKVPKDKIKIAELDKKLDELLDE